MLQQYPDELVKELSTLLIEFQTSIEHVSDVTVLTDLSAKYIADKEATLIRYGITL